MISQYNSKQKRPKIILCGSPEFAATTFQAMLDSNQFEILAVITETDKPSGRGAEVRPTPVKTFAIKNNLLVLQPHTLKGITNNNGSIATNNQQNLAFVESLSSLKNLDAIITVAYGKIIPQGLIDFPKYGIINAHASLLPRWRGAAPIHRALFSGDNKTGVCLMQTIKELDAGPVFCSQETTITEDDSFYSLHNRLATISVNLLNNQLPLILSGHLLATPQPTIGITHASKWQALDRQINWTEDASTTLRRIRTCSPEPGARTRYNDTILKVYSARRLKDQNFPKRPPGTIVEANRAELIVAVGDSEFLALEELQFPGKKRLPISEILKSRHFQTGQIFS
jgi:methionyl-tRNA formyltransferase